MTDKIAKYRKIGSPGEWFLTDFTMNQVEMRLSDLETEVARLTALVKQHQNSATRDRQTKKDHA